jgi:hypothetical protein
MKALFSVDCQFSPLNFIGTLMTHVAPASPKRSLAQDHTCEKQSLQQPALGQGFIALNSPSGRVNGASGA